MLLCLDNCVHQPQHTGKDLPPAYFGLDVRERKVAREQPGAMRYVPVAEGSLVVSQLAGHRIIEEFDLE